MVKSEQAGGRAGPAQWRTALNVFASPRFGSEIVGTGARPPWWRTALYILLTGFLGLLSVVFSPVSWAMQQGASGSTTLLAALALLVAVGLPVILVWRHRSPFVTTLVATAVALVLPIGNALPLTALAALVGRRRGPAVWWTTGLVALITTWIVIADALAQPRGASWWKTLLGPQVGDPSQLIDLGVPEVAIIILLGLGLSIGAGLLVRSRREAASATEAVEVHRETSERLEDEVARRQERERIAREVHDAMGHRLSLLNLHAGALEANAAADPRMAESAHLVRQSATDAMDDLRSLLDLLREPLGTDAGPAPLSKLAEVVAESFGAGQALSSSIFISDPDTAAPALSRAVYRIVQELLTNARKHAPQEQVFLTVEGSPATGVVIECRNRYVGGWGAPGSKSSRGLGGINERVELLGGTAAYGLDGQSFRVRVQLPWWQAAPAS